MRSGLCHTRHSAPSHVLLKNRRQCVHFETHLKWPSGRDDFILPTVFKAKTLRWAISKRNMQPREWRSDPALGSSSYVQQHSSTSFCIDNILGKPSVTASAQRSPVAPICNMEQPRFHESYRTPAYPMVFPTRSYGTPFMPYQRHHPYAMPPMGYNIQAPVIPSIYDAFQDPLGKYHTIQILSLYI